MEKELKYSIVVPVFNETGNIRETYGILKSLCNIKGQCPKIIFVDDGSTDGSAEALDELASKDPSITVIHHPANRGYGAALKTGILASDEDLVVITDSDSTYPNEAIPGLIAEMSSSDMVVGARTGANVNIPLVRRPAKWAINKLANYLSGTKIPDLNSGLRAMRREIIKKFINILPEGFSFTTTITLAMLTNGYRVKFMPIDYAKRKGKSKIRPIRDTLNFTFLIIRVMLYFEPLKIFVPLSLMFFISAVAVLFGSYYLLDRIMDTTTVVLFMGAVQMLAIGMLADLIDKRMR